MDTVAAVDPILELDEPVLEVEPGVEVRVRLTVRNDGDTVDRLRLDVLGEAGRWGHVEPRHVAVAPGADEVVEVVFRSPPAAAAPACEIPFAVRASSPHDRERAAVVEGDLRVGAVPGLGARIEPARAAGRWGAGYRVRLENRGARALTLRFAASDPPRALRYAVAPRDVTLPAGGTGAVLVSARTRTPKLTGPRVSHDLRVEYRVEGSGSTGLLPATFEQRAVLPAPVFGAAALVVLALLAGVLLLALPEGVTGPGTGPTPTPTAAGDPVRGFAVFYGPPTPVDDAANEGVAQELVDRLQAAGVDARLVDSRDSEQLDDGPGGLWVVLQDGFADRTAAEAECEARRAVAPACVVVAPR